MIVYKSLSDNELFELLKVGDHNAFAEIYDRYFTLLYLHASSRLGSEEDAKDIVQTLFTTLWLKREDIFIKIKLSSYLYRAVRNRVLDVIARKRLETDYFSTLPQTIDLVTCETDYHVREQQLAEIIEEEIKTMPSRMREVFELSRKENLSHKEIASKLDLSEETVRSHIKKALKKLRNKLGLVFYMFWLFY